ncbi:OmpA family protein, partial [Thiotrichales bacterium HSG1]|nr:OmpA family protein [Thiotrichales bacterium HSG1]
VLIGGHTDSRGGNEYNLGLSQRRADAVRFTLIQNNVASSRIRTQGFGESQPVASNSSINGRQQNRRVEITILNEGISF